MRRTIIGICLGLVALVAVAEPAAAQQNANPKFGYVNSREIMKQTPGYAAAESAYSKEFDAFQAEVQRLRTSFDSSVSDFQRQSTMLTATQRTAKQKALEEQGQKAQQRIRELEGKIAKREEELLDPIQAKVKSVIEGVRAAGNYHIVFDVSAPGNAIVAADRSLDLTERVIQQLKSGN